MSERQSSVLDFYETEVFDMPEAFFRMEAQGQPMRPSTRTRTRITFIPRRVLASAALAVATTFLPVGGSVTAGSRSMVHLEARAHPSARVPTMNSWQLRNAETVGKLFVRVPPDDGDDPDYGF